MITSADIPAPKPEPDHRPLHVFSSQAGVASIRGGLMFEDDIFGAGKHARETWDEIPADEETTCPTCRAGGTHPPHMPSLRCENGGTNVHCSCRACW